MKYIIAFALMVVALVSSQNSFSQYAAAPGLSYEVQIGVFSQKHEVESFGYPAHVKERQVENHKFQYTCGEFPSYHAANNYKYVLNSLGAQDAFIVAFIDKEQVTMDQAATYIKSYEEGVAEEIAE